MLIEEFADYISHVVTSPGSPLIVGDFNFHISEASGKEFMALCHSLDLKQHVCGATHRNGNILDLVLTKSDDKLVTATASADHGFPDHYPVFSHLSLQKPCLPKQEVTNRKLKSITSRALMGALRESSLSSVDITTLSLDALTDLYHTELQSVLDDLAPLKTRTITVRPEAKWYDDSIRQAKQKRRQAA